MTEIDTPSSEQHIDFNPDAFVSSGADAMDDIQLSNTQVVEYEAEEPVVEEGGEKEVEKENTSVQSSPEGPLSAKKRFETSFDLIWEVLQNRGWNLLESPDATYCLMPGTTFQDLRPNINTFESKEHACWKFLYTSAEDASKHPSKAMEQEEKDRQVWDRLWHIAQKYFHWTSMALGQETVFVQPNTPFTQLIPNETMFTSVACTIGRCLANEKIIIDLGDSADGRQKLDFSKLSKKTEKPTSKARKKIFNTPSPASTKDLITPPYKTASADKKIHAKKKAPKKTDNEDPYQVAISTFKYEGPTFECKFGRVYDKLQEEGWTHKPGMFEYDYFSPTYDTSNQKEGENYFKSSVALENYLKESGVWARVREELKQEHDDMIHEMEADEFEKHLGRTKRRLDDKKRREALKKKSVKKEAMKNEPAEFTFTREDAASGQDTPASKPAPKSAKKHVKSTKPKAKIEKKVEEPVQRKRSASLVEAQTRQLTNGIAVNMLVRRGWRYEPGRFEYDYFKPGATRKSVLGEDWFQSEADLQFYLQREGIWDQLAEELQAEYDEECAQVAISRSQESSDAEPTPKKQKVDVIANASRALELQEEQELTQDIWPESQEFAFA